MVPTTQREDTKLPTAHSLQDAANSDNTLEGYAAINNVSPDSDIAHSAIENPVDLHEQIQIRAYQIYCDRSGDNGSADDDWYRAEREILARGGKGHSPDREAV